VPHSGRTRRSRATPLQEAPGAATQTSDAAEPSPQRLDKWLWFARLARTRTLAARLVEGGKIRVNREKVLKPAHTVRPGDVITAALGGRVRIARILEPGARRGSAEEAQLLYEDLTPPPQDATARTAGPGAQSRAAGGARPTKRKRRKLDALRAKASDDDA